VVVLSQDVVTYKQETAIYLSEKQAEILNADENLYYIVKFLRVGPRTVKELEKDFTHKGIKKSDKSIYRYLKSLIEIGLVAKAGKRITSKGASELHSETIYIRTAKIFLTANLKKKLNSLEDKDIGLFHDTVYSLLAGKYKDEIKSDKGVDKLIDTLESKKQELVKDIFGSANEETMEKISNLDWGLVEYLIEYIGWLALSLEYDIVKEIEDCCR
jgi:predicted transcriptional regulator